MTEVPSTVPAVRLWHRTGGSLTLGRDAQVHARGVVAGEVERFLPELRRLTGAVLVPGTVGDVAVRVESSLPAEGYRLRIGDRVDLAAADLAGAAYGLSTLVQLLRTSAELPSGQIDDHPQYPVRGVMLDLGRRYCSMSYLRALLAELEWRRCNRLHLHLTDWNAIRVDLGGEYRGLAAEQSYDRSDIAELVRLAARHHVTLVPEIDLPAHATAFVRARPGLAFPAAEPAMNSNAHGESPPAAGWTVDVTRADNRAWLVGFVHEVAAAFDTTSVHIGGDEWQDGAVLEQSPSLRRYARSLDPSFHAVDGLIAFLDELHTDLAADGRATEIWSWWERTEPRTTQPSRDITVTAWSDTEDEIASFLRDGYPVIASPMRSHYLTPLGFPGERSDADHRTRVADARWLYETWQPRRHPLLRGYQLCVWADFAQQEDDAYFDRYLSRALVAHADRLWHGAAGRDVDAFFDLVDALGPAPSSPARWSGTRVVAIGTSATFDAQSLRALRFRPHPPEDGWTSPYDTGGCWAGPSQTRLEQLRGAVVQVADAGGWRDVRRIDLLAAATWNIVWLPEPALAVAARLVAADGGVLPDEVVDVQWLA